MSFRLKTILGIASIEALLLTLLIASVLNYLHTSNEQQLIHRATTTATLASNSSSHACKSR